MKVSRYSNPSYCLSYDGDTVFVNLVIDITRVSEQSKQFTASIVKAQLDCSQEQFPISILKFLDANALRTVQNDLESRLLAELIPSLFTLFYVGELLPDATNTTA